jgi:hypothetical protein
MADRCRVLAGTCINSGGFCTIKGAGEQIPTAIDSPFAIKP